MRVRPKYILPITGTLTQGVDPVQTLTADAAAVEGSFKITMDAVETAAIAWNSTAAQIKVIVEAHVSVGSGNCTVTGGPVNTHTSPIVITGANDLSGKPFPTITITSDSTLDATGDAPVTISVAQTVTGVVGSYRGFPKDDTILIKTDGIGLAYYNAGTSHKPTWTALKSGVWGSDAG